MMMGSLPWNRTGQSPLARLLAGATLAFFLLGQPAVICLPLCLSGAHYQTAPAMHQHAGVQPCHSVHAFRTGLSISPALSLMLPAAASPTVPSLRVVPLEIASPAAFRAEPPPSLDPPPPRLI
jgi:hypothetical protein